MRLSALQVVFLIGVGLHQAESLNILAVLPFEGKSHFFVFQPLLRELATRGHNVTVISQFPQENPIPNYHDISVAGKSTILEGMVPIERPYWSLFLMSLILVYFGTANCRLVLGDEDVQQLWKTEAKFDVVLVEQFQSDCPLALAYKLGAPVVGLTSHVLMPWHYQRFGIEFNSAHMSFMFLDGGTNPTFYQRLERIFFNAYYNFVYKYIDQRVDEATIAQYFDNVPPLENLAQEIKMILLYQHHTLVGSNMYPASVKEVGGYHVAKPKELPEEIKKFIEESEHGVIYISFGSILRANTTPREKVEAIVAAVSELPQRVIWKWEENKLPGNPKNIYLSNWLPQNDILAYPKVLAFYSHCGMLGTTEAIHHGVPVVGMPVFGDQPNNAAMVAESGLGVQIQITELTKELLLEKFKIVLDPKFRAQVKRLSKAWHDRPQSAMDGAIYWIEYAARNRDLTLKSPAVNVPYYKTAGLDVLALFLGVLIVLAIVVRYACGKSSIKYENPKKKRL